MLDLHCFERRKIMDKNTIKNKAGFLGIPSNVIAVYTVLNVLLKMRKDLGLEAMMEYIDRYLGVMEMSNPDMKRAVNVALSLVDVREIYDEAMR